MFFYIQIFIKNTLINAVGIGFHWLYDLVTQKKNTASGFENIERTISLF